MTRREAGYEEHQKKTRRSRETKMKSADMKIFTTCGNKPLSWRAKVGHNGTVVKPRGSLRLRDAKLEKYDLEAKTREAKTKDKVESFKAH